MNKNVYIIVVAILKTVPFAQPFLTAVRAIHQFSLLQEKVIIGTLADREYPISVPHLKITGNSAMSIVVAILKTVPFAVRCGIVGFIIQIATWKNSEEKVEIGMHAEKDHAPLPMASGMAGGTGIGIFLVMAMIGVINYLEI